MRFVRVAFVAFAALVVLAILALAGFACVPRERTTPLGYVVAPSSPLNPDAGADAASDPDAASTRPSALPRVEAD